MSRETITMRRTVRLPADAPTDLEAFQADAAPEPYEPRLALLAIALMIGTVGAGAACCFVTGTLACRGQPADLLTVLTKGLAITAAAGLCLGMLSLTAFPVFYKFAGLLFTSHRRGRQPTRPHQ